MLRERVLEWERRWALQEEKWEEAREALELVVTLRAELKEAKCAAAASLVEVEKVDVSCGAEEGEDANDASCILSATSIEDVKVLPAAALHQGKDAATQCVEEVAVVAAVAVGSLPSHSSDNFTQSDDSSNSPSMLAEVLVRPSAESPSAHITSEESVVTNTLTEDEVAKNPSVNSRVGGEVVVGSEEWDRLIAVAVERRTRELEEVYRERMALEALREGGGDRTVKAEVVLVDTEVQTDLQQGDAGRVGAVYKDDAALVSGVTAVNNTERTGGLHGNRSHDTKKSEGNRAVLADSDAGATPIVVPVVSREAPLVSSTLPVGNGAIAKGELGPTLVSRTFPTSETSSPALTSGVSSIGEKRTSLRPSGSFRRNDNPSTADSDSYYTPLSSGGALALAALENERVPRQVSSSSVHLRNVVASENTPIEDIYEDSDHLRCLAGYWVPSCCNVAHSMDDCSSSTNVDISTLLAGFPAALSSIFVRQPGTAANLLRIQQSSSWSENEAEYVKLTIHAQDENEFATQPISSLSFSVGHMNFIGQSSAHGPCFGLVTSVDPLFKVVSILILGPQRGQRSNVNMALDRSGSYLTFELTVSSGSSYDVHLKMVMTRGNQMEVTPIPLTFMNGQRLTRWSMANTHSARALRGTRVSINQHRKRDLTISTPSSVIEHSEFSDSQSVASESNYAESLFSFFSLSKSSTTSTFSALANGNGTTLAKANNGGTSTKPFTEFVVTVVYEDTEGDRRSNTGPLSWEVFHRYSNFSSLKEFVAVESSGKSELKLPRFPGKTFTEPIGADLVQRMKGLEAYVNALLQCGGLGKPNVIDVLAAFLEVRVL